MTAKARRADFTGFIDVTGKEVLRPAFKTFGEFDACGLATFKGGNHRHGYMDASGEPRIPPRSVEATGFAKNGLAKVRIGEKWGFIDTAGNVYIADTGNFRIRKVSPDGIITTVAGNGTDFPGAPTCGVTYGGDWVCR